MTEVQHVTIDGARAGQRIDNFLIGFLRGVPRSRVYRLIRRGEVRVNGSRIRPEYKLAGGDLVRIPPVRVAPERERSRDETRERLLAEAILHEDDRLLVLNKPAGIAVHGGSGIRLGVIESLRQARPDLPYLELVHRLDRGTSGCLLLAKRRSELRALHELLREHRLEKRYLALVEGNWPAAMREIAAPLTRTRERRGGGIARVAAPGKEARTRFRVRLRLGEFTLVEAIPTTGRTHQIRVHAQFAGHPIVGDERYGTRGLIRTRFGRGFARMYLHASEITIPPVGRYPERRFRAPTDEQFEHILELLQ